MVQITYIFMVMRNKIVLDQLPDRAARLKVLPFASFTPIAVVGTARCVSDIIQYAHFPGTAAAMSRCAADWAGAPLPCRGGW